ncbi:MAG: hypothetical protein K0R29_2653 [Pseudobdellovibrio sp.]|jgi:phosphatidylserine/phosphatidylglycerophosphate/cardiolipin synthase-like enzyme|nr:hypothetical protein [Pseudobdellovibrio sp.]
MGAPNFSKVKLVTDDEYLDALLPLLDKAKTKIDILAFSFAIGSAAGKINFGTTPFIVAEKLVQLKKENKKLKIRVFLEGWRETSIRNRVTGAYLKKNKIDVKYGSTHAKGFAVDDRYVFFGSTNLTHQSIVKNNETNLLIDSAEVAAEFEKYFMHLWKGGSHGEIHLNKPMLADGDFKDELIKVIRAAKKRIDFSIYFFHHAEIEKALLEAHKRGVSITGYVHNHGAFALSYVRRSLATARRLFDSGIKKIYFGPKHLFSHAKFLVADGKTILMGTGNWLPEDVNIHPQLYIGFENKVVAKKLLSYFKTKLDRESLAK